MGDESYVKFPDHLSVAAHFGTIEQATVAGIEGEWGFLRLDRHLSLNLGFAYDQSISPAPRPESNLWATDLSRYAAHIGANYRLLILSGRNFALGLNPAVRFFLGAQSYSPRLSEDPAVLRDVRDRYCRFNACTDATSNNPETWEPYPRGAPNGSRFIYGLQAGGSLFLSINGDRIIRGLGWVDLSLGAFADTEGGILFSPGIQGNF